MSKIIANLTYYFCFTFYAALLILFFSTIIGLNALVYHTTDKLRRAYSDY